jgi:cytochrome c peroxidase
MLPRAACIVAVAEEGGYAMKPTMPLGIVCVATAGALLLFSSTGARAQNPSPVPIFPPRGFVVPPADVPCILPGNKLDLQCWIKNDPDAARVVAEEAALEAEALAAAKSGTLDPFHQVETLGELEIFDPSLSVNGNLACSYCHDPAAGYANGSSILSIYTGGTNPGSVPITVTRAYPDNRIAKRNPQSYNYSPYFPPLQFNPTQGDFYGGNFWDARATGFRLQNSAADQAQDPPVDPEEMGNPDSACVVWKLSLSQYAFFFEEVWGTGSLSGITFPSNVAQVCSIPKGAVTPPAQLLALSSADRTHANQAFDEFGLSIAAYEISSAVSSFTSKFDAYLAGSASLTAAELSGYDLFRGKANCNTCHLDGRSNTQAPGETDNGLATNVAPLFTDFTYNNLGLPRNLALPWYSENKPDQFGFTGNPLGAGFIDEGVGLFLDEYYGSPPPNFDWIALNPFFVGKFQTSTLRDAGQVPPPTPPNTTFVKAYMHNGYLLSLKEVVHFYNTRDEFAFNVQSGHCPTGTVEKVTCWPTPEEQDNKNMTIGNLGLTDAEENDLVAFLETLTDGFVSITPALLSKPAVVRKAALPPSHQ